MKFTVVLLVAILVATPGLCQVSQQWGYLHPNSALLYQREVRFINNRPPNTRVTQTVSYPLLVEDEIIPISCVRVIHERQFESTFARIQWGGPGNKFVGVELVSAPGRHIRSIVQVYY